MKEQKKKKRYSAGKKHSGSYSMDEVLESFDDDYGDDYEETFQSLKAGKRVGARRLQ